MTEPVSEQCLFCAIGAGEIAASVVKDYEDVMVFRDVSPQAPVHLLVIPKAHHPNLDEVLRENPQLGVRLLSAACQAANAEGLDPPGTGWSQTPDPTADRPLHMLTSMFWAAAP